MTGAKACGTFFLNHYIHGGAHSLAGNLHQPEFAQRQYVVARAVLLHDLHHVFVELVAVFSLCHINKINDNNAADIAQSQLARNLFGCPYVYIVCSELLRFGVLGAVAAINVYYMQSLRMLNHKVGTTLESDSLAKRRFYLLRYGKLVENRNVALLELHNILFLRCNHF